MLTFARVYGPGVVYNPRTAWAGFHKMGRSDASVRDAMVATYVTITGGAPLICLRAVVSDGARELLGGFGLPWPEHALTYSNVEEYEQILGQCVADNSRMVFQHAHPADPRLDPIYWIPRELLTTLNDKGEMARFVPPECCPPRQVVSLDEAVAWRFVPGTTVVFKGATRMSSGSGGAVMIARTEADFRALAERLAGCERVVVEEFQPFARTFCLNFAADYKGETHFIGSADQVVADDGTYLSGWIGPEFAPPDPAVALGHEIIRRAADLGYVGYAGFDVGILPGGRPLIFDLNFRICSSTIALLWYPEVRRRFGPETHVRILNASASMPFEGLCGLARGLVEQGIVFPFGAFDPTGSIWADRPPTLRGAVIGRNRAETEARCEALSAQGLRFR